MNCAASGLSQSQFECRNLNRNIVFSVERAPEACIFVCLCVCVCLCICLCVRSCVCVHFHLNMKKFHVLHLIFLCSGSLYAHTSSNIWCQSFDWQTKSMEQYCEQYQKGSLPQYCLYEQVVRIKPTRVTSLSIGGCEPAIVLHSIEQFKNLQILNISHSGYTTLNWLRNMTLMQLHRFNASYNELTYVFQLLKNTTPDVIELDLSHNKLMNIGAHTFGMATNKLTTIHLSYNQLEHISFDAFMESTQLAFIDLRMNRFHAIPPLFEGKQLLQTILLNGNPITRFNYCYLSLMHFTSIHFSWQNVEEFWRSQECIANPIEPLRIVLNSDYEGILHTNNYELHCNEQSFKNLKKFTAGHINSFTNIVDLLYAFDSTILHMDLAGNYIGTLTKTDQFERFDRLTTLSLSNTQLIDFDFCKFNKQLIKLDLSFNQLKRIENAPLIKEFMSLMIFNISENRIENVPDLLQHMSSTVKWLDLSGNYVGRLNASTFKRLPSLRMLNLRNSNLLNLSDLSPFKTLDNLNVLNLSFNNLKKVNFSLLSNLSMLNDLNVAHCRIENILHVTQYLDGSLRMLDLSGNNVPSLNDRMFKTLVNLEFLNISNANVFLFDAYTLKRQSGLRCFDISGNQLQTIDLRSLPNVVEKLSLNGNNLYTIENLNRTNHLRMKMMAIAHNQLSCQFLRSFLPNWRGLLFIGDPVDQKHGDVCRSSSQGVNDFLSTFYDTIKFW